MLAKTKLNTIKLLISKALIDSYIDYERKTQKAIEQKIGEFFRIDLNKEYIDIFKVINEIFRHIKQLPNQQTKQSTKKTLIGNISMRLLGLKFKSDNTLKSKAMKYIAKNILPTY